MENEMDKQTDSKPKKGKLHIIILVIIFIVLVIAAITLKIFVLKHEENKISDVNNSQENLINKDNSTTIPEDSIENADTANTDKSSESTNMGEVTENTDINEIEENTTASKADEIVTNAPTEKIKENTSQWSDTINQNTNANTGSISNTSTTSTPSSNTNSNSSANPNSNSVSSNNSSNSNNEESNKSQTTQEPTTPSTPETYIIKTEDSKELTNSETKYGVIINTYTTSTYYVYSDGSKKLISSYDTIEYDRTNYNATTSELLPEAKTSRNQYASQITQVLKNVNLYRQEANTNSVDNVSDRSDLVLSDDLCVAACARAIEIAYSSQFSHTRPNGDTCISILDEMNISYKTAGENIAYGYATADDVSAGWKTSQGHYSNMINSSFSKIGIGVFKFEGLYYWVQIFN